MQGVRVLEVVLPRRVSDLPMGRVCLEGTGGRRKL